MACFVFTINNYANQLCSANKTETLQKSSFAFVSDETNKFKVPNVVHYIWYAEKNITFSFDKYLSVLSAMKYIKPEAVYFHTDKPPVGTYFDKLKENPVFKVSI